MMKLIYLISCMPYQIAAALVVLTFFLNFIWETGQAPLYQAYGGFSENWTLCAQAALGDIVMVGIIFGAMGFLFGGGWIYRLYGKYLASLFLIGGVLAVVVEKWGLGTGRWQYDAMPIIPFLGIGLTPVLQMLIIPLAVAFAWRIIASIFGQKKAF